MLLGPAEVRALAAGLRLRPTKQLGQNFVIDANTVRRIVRAAGVGPDDVVLEVGPGPRLADPGAAARGRPRVIAVEIDPVLAAALPATVAARAPGLADRLRGRRPPTRCGSRDLPGPPPTALVANLPYNVAVPVCCTCWSRLPSLRARPGDGAGRGRRPAGRGARLARCTACRRSRLAWYADVRAGRHGRPRTCSGPRPTSTPAWSRSTRREPPATEASTREQVFAVVDAAFAQRRKTLRAALAVLGRVRGRRPSGRCAPPGSIPAPAARRIDVTAFARIAETSSTS